EPPSVYVPASSIWIGPLIVFPEGWSGKYFKRLLNRPFEPGELLDRHWFRNHFRNPFCDEHGDPVEGEAPLKFGVPAVWTLHGIAETIKERRAGWPDMGQPPCG